MARDRTPLEELRAQLGGTFTPVAADATDPVVAGLLLDQHRPRTLVLNAGAAPLTRPIHRHTWQTFSRNWDVDVQHVFNWTREALLLPLEPGSVVIAMSSGAAPTCSPPPASARRRDGLSPVAGPRSANRRISPHCHRARAGGHGVAGYRAHRVGA